MPTPVRLQHTDGRTVEMWLENDIVDLDRILINGKWFRAADDDPDDAMPTYKEEPTREVTPGIRRGTRHSSRTDRPPSGRWARGGSRRSKA